MCLFPQQKYKNPHTGDRLRENRCQRCAAHAHVQSENKYRIENNVGHRPDEHRQHARLRKSLRCDKGIHSQCELHKNRSKRINVHIIHAIVYRIGAGAEGHQKIPVPQKKRRCQQDRNNDLNHKTVPQRLLRLVMFSLSHENGSPGCATVRHKSRKCRHDHNKRHADAHTGERHGSLLRDMPNINPVHNIIHHIDELRRHRRDRQPEQKPSHRLRPQKIFLFIHSSIPFLFLMLYSTLYSLRPKARCAFCMILRLIAENVSISS